MGPIPPCGWSLISKICTGDARLNSQSTALLMCTATKRCLSQTTDTITVYRQVCDYANLLRLDLSAVLGTRRLVRKHLHRVCKYAF